MDSSDRQKLTNSVESDEDKIMLIAENQSIEDEVLPLLIEEFSSLTVKRADQRTLDDIETSKPHVLVFACNRLSIVEEFYLGLYGAGGSFLGNLHESIVLCTSEEVKRCYELCTQGVFNDYVMFRPIYEPYRLLLTIQHAIDRRKLKMEKGFQRQGYNMINTQLAGLARGLDGTAENCANLNQVAENVRQGLIRSMETNLDQFRGSIEGGVADSGITITNKKTADQLFNRFKQESVKKTVEINTQNLADSIGAVAQSVTQQRSAINNLTDEFQQVSGTDQRRVLLAEDDEIYQEIISDLLTADGFMVDVVADGSQALLKLASNIYDLIISDISMPQMDGVQLMEILKQSDVYRNVPVVITTGESSKSMVRKCVEIGASSYVVKPFERNFFLDRLKQSMRV